MPVVANSISDATDLQISDKPVRLVKENDRRARITIWAGNNDLWFGGTARIDYGTVGNRVDAGTSVEITTRGEIWCVREPGVTALASYSEEFV